MKRKDGAPKTNQYAFDNASYYIWGLGQFGTEQLAEKEECTILRSQEQAIKILELKTSGCNRSKAQTREPRESQEPFDPQEWAFRRGKYLPAKRDEILSAIEKNDLDYFVRLGKTIAALKKQLPGEEVDALGYFLTRHWIAEDKTGHVPSFSMLSAKVLAEACWRCRRDFVEIEKLSKDYKATHFRRFAAAIESVVERLDLRRVKKSVRIGHCAHEIERPRILYVAKNPDLLRKFESKSERKQTLIC